jgi:DNA-binding CsgD family transcriptional regulator
MVFDPVKTPEDVLLEREQRDMLNAEMLKLSPRMERVLRLRADGCTLQEIGNQYGVQQERIRQIEAKAHRVLKRGLWRYRYPDEWHALQVKTAAEDKARRAAVLAEAEERQRKYDQRQSDPAAQAAQWVEAHLVRHELDNAYNAPLSALQREQADLREHAAERAHQREKAVRRRIEKARQDKQDAHFFEIRQRVAEKRWVAEAGLRAWAKEQARAAWNAQLAGVVANINARAEAPRGSHRDWLMVGTQ